jgi:hypothetical protein
VHNIVLPAEPKQHHNQTYSNYKTIKCKYFDLGSCKNGDKCSFAHGEVDLRAGSQQPGNYPPQQSYHPHVQEGYQAPAFPALNESQIIFYQLSLIIQRLYELYPTNEVVQYHLKHAVDLLNSGNIDISADTLHVG